MPAERSWYWQEYDDTDLHSLRKSYERVVENAKDQLERIEKELTLRSEDADRQAFI